MLMTDRFSVQRFWKDVRSFNVTLSGGFGLMRLLYQEPSQRDDADNSIRQLIVPHADGPLQESFEKRFNIKVTDGYGMTEIDPVLACTMEDNRPGSCGKVPEDLEVQIFDDDDHELQPGEIGEIVVRPRKPDIMFKEYYKMPEKTLERWRNGWFHTDDYGFHDRDGYFYFIGGKNGAIKYRGENVSPFELEEIICSHPSVLEVVAVGVPSSLGGEDVKVVVRLAAGLTMTPEQLMEFCEPRMASFMLPRYIEFTEEFIKTKTGDINKNNLQNNTNQTWDRKAPPTK